MNKKEVHGKSIFKMVTVLILTVLLVSGVVITVLMQDRSVAAQSTIGKVKKAESTTTYRDVYLALQKSQKAEASMLDGAGTFRTAGEESVSLADTAEAAPAEAGKSLEASYGKTNIQVEGVDEADIVKNDGQYLYILSDEEGWTTKLLSIVEISSMTLMYQTRFSQDEYFQEMYVKDDRLVLLGSQFDNSNTFARKSKAFNNYYGSNTRVLIYDISDRKNIHLAREFSHEGDYVSSRLVGDNLYIVSTFYQYPDVSILREDNVEDLVPHTKDSSDHSIPKPLPADCISISQNPGSAFTVVSGLNITDDTPASTKSVMGTNGCIVYSTASHLYVANGWNSDTELMRYSLRDGEVSYDGKATIPGYLKDQFALDEYNGYLRAATTSYINEPSQTFTKDIAADIAIDIGFSNGNTVNNLYILDKNLNITGKIEGLAEDEVIQSVRYMGDMAYVVTFRQTDPLFAIDVSDPQNPQVLGQLKIPGFSSYMHPLDQNTLLGIGYDADEETGGTTGLKLSLFDVSDPMKPTETHKLVISGECHSIATSNHKAVTYIADKKLLALPIEIYGKVSVGEKRFSAKDGAGVFMIEVDKAQGLSLKTALTDPKMESNIENGVWEYTYDRSIFRTTYWNDAFLTISNRSVLRFHLETLTLEKQLDLYS